MLCTASSAHNKNARTQKWPVAAENRSLQESDPAGGAGGSQTDAASRITNNESNSQTRKLMLRKARFRGVAVAPRNFTPPSHTGGSGDFGYDADALEDVDSSPLDTRNHKVGLDTGITDDTGVLQEISNSSMRRKKKNRTRGRSSLPRSTSISQGPAGSLASLYQFPDTEHSASSTKVPDTSNSQLLTTSSSGPLGGTRPRGGRANPAKSTNFRQFAHETETKQYIDHLESHLAVLEAQINSFDSTDSTRAQAAKLRALVSESRVLRQEVLDWEERFDERVHQQVEEHEVTIRSLRAQVKLVQRASDTANENMKLMEADSEGMKQQIESVERLNQDLERRVELMSEMLAMSPTKANFDGDVPRRSPSRPTSRILPVSSSSRFAISPRDPGACFNRQATPGRSSVSSRQPSLGDNNASACLVRPGTYRASSMDLGSEKSRRTLIDDEFPSSERHRFTGQFFQSDNESRMRPARRMRRFYTGSTGPKALILPVTAQSGPFITSVPVTAAHTPSISAQSLTDFSLPPSLQRTNSTPCRAQNLPISYGKDEPAERILLADDTLTIPKFLSDSFPAQNTTPPSHHPATDSINTGTMSSTSHASITPGHGDTLFQELVRVKSRNDSTDVSEVTTPDVVDRTISPDLSVTEENAAYYDPFQSPKKILDPGNDAELHISPRETTIPLQGLARLTAAATKSIDHRIPRIKYIMTRAWSMLTLSRPVLEFRWWLVTLLVGGLRKRYSRSALLRRSETGSEILPQPRLAKSSSFGHDGACDDEDDSETRETVGMTARGGRKTSHFARRHPPSYASESALWDIFETRDNYKHATPPPISWLKFSITLVFAVGIAIKDGPASLFRQRGAQWPPSSKRMEPVIVSEGSALDSNSDGDY